MLHVYLLLWVLACACAVMGSWRVSQGRCSVRLWSITAHLQHSKLVQHTCIAQLPAPRAVLIEACCCNTHGGFHVWHVNPTRLAGCSSVTVGVCTGCNHSCVAALQDALPTVAVSG
jgi:hypothetical protein